MSGWSHPFPIKPFDVAIEILSQEDRMQRVLRKCRGFTPNKEFPVIYIFDPEDRTAQRWIPKKDALEPIAALFIGDRKRIDVVEIWAALDKELEQVDVLPY